MTAASTGFVDLSVGGGASFRAYLAVPGKPNGAGIVVLQEIFGLNANMRSVCDWLADRGYHAIAPDLFWRQEAGVELNPRVPEDFARGAALFRGLDQSLAVADSLVAAAFLRDWLGSAAKIGAVGYCLGGKIAFLLAMADGLEAAVAYYGVGIQDGLADADRVQAPLLLHFGDVDPLCPPAAVDSIHQALAPKGDKAVIVDHAGASHGFARIGGEAYHAEAAARANEWTLDFLAVRLGVEAF